MDISKEFAESHLIRVLCLSVIYWLSDRCQIILWVTVLLVVYKCMLVSLIQWVWAGVTRLIWVRANGSINNNVSGRFQLHLICSGLVYSFTRVFVDAQDADDRAENTNSNG